MKSHAFIGQHTCL